jgi:4-amino-4-deoxy-L-arabinose transferase-like glycosyltransferase
MSSLTQNHSSPSQSLARLKSCFYLTAPTSFRVALLYIFLLTFFSRFCAGLWTGNNLLNSEFAILARNLIHGNGLSFGGIHPTAWRMPMYPLLLAGWMKLFGETKLAILILNSFAGAINAILCGYLARKIFGKTTGVIAACLYMLIPYLVQKEAITESAWVSLGLLGGLYLLLNAKKQRPLLNVAASGLLFCLAYLTRPTVGLIPLFIFGCLLLKAYQKKKNQYFIRAIVFICAFVIGILPWAIRNKLTLGHFYFAQTNFWYNFYMGNHRHTFEMYPNVSLDNIRTLYPYKERLPQDEFKKEEWHFQIAKEEMRTIGPARMLGASLKKLFLLWSIRMTPYLKRIEDPATGFLLNKERGVIENLIFTIPYLFITCLAFLGSWQIRRRLPQLILFAAGFLLFFSLPYMLTYAYSRHAVPAYFILIILAAKGITSLRRSLNI